MSPDLIPIRASSLSGLFDCPARWEATHLLGKHMPSSSKATLGRAVHASTAVFDQSAIDGAGITIIEAGAAAVDAIHHPQEDVVWEDDSGPQEAEKIALALHGKYCVEIAPQQTYQAVEVYCASLDIPEIGISLTGTADRIRQTDEGPAVSDLKTGKAAVGTDGTVATKGHAYQLGVYELLAEYGSGIAITGPAQIIGMNTAKTDKGQRIGFGEIRGAREVLLGEQGVPGILEMASKIIHTGNFWGNPKSMMCHGNYCPVYSTCQYRK